MGDRKVTQRDIDRAWRVLDEWLDELREHEPQATNPIQAIETLKENWPHRPEGLYYGGSSE